jgi:preprotein translocase subunit SecY
VLPARSSVLSIKLNSAGALIPIMVAPWFWSLPLTVAAENFGKHAPWLITLKNQVAYGTPAGLIIGSIVMFVVALVYASRVLDPERTAESLGKLHGTIPGVEPGELTADYLDRLLSPITLVGAVYIVAISAISEVFAARGDALVSYEIGGGSALVVVCTILDIQKQVRELSRTYVGGEHR